jgi:hypothetical protein
MGEGGSDEQATEEPQMAESVLTADRWSKIAGLVVAICVFVLAQLTTSDTQFNAIVAAVAGIGIRIYIPYHASLSVTDPDAMSIASHPETGDYHYGAVGLALLVAPFVALGVMIAVASFNLAIVVGILGGLVAFVVLRSVLPRD